MTYHQSTQEQWSMTILEAPEGSKNLGVETEGPSVETTHTSKAPSPAMEAKQSMVKGTRIPLRLMVTTQLT